MTSLGSLVAFLVAPILVKPLYRWQGRRNGAPYRVGDTVRIIGGAHVNQIGSVNAVWDEQLQVQVRLVDQSPQEKDVYSFVQVCRMANAQKDQSHRPL